MDLAKWMVAAALAAGAAAAPAGTAILGDVNLDNRVTAKDASWMLAEYASLSTSQDTTLTDPQQKSNADVDGNGVVDAVDAGLVLVFYSYLSTGGEGTTMEEWLATTGTGATGDGNPDAAVNKPVLTVTVDGTAGGKVFDPADARGKQVSCTIEVSGANKAYAATGFRVRYDARLALATDEFGEIDVMSGDALEGLATGTPVEDPTAPTGTKGFFVASAGKTNYGLDGTMWTFSFTVPEDAAAGDVYPIDIVASTTGTPHDLFVGVPVTAAGLDMQAYAFSKGIFSASNPNAFATGADVAACAALAGIAGDADGYIAIAGPASATYPLWVGGVQVCETNQTDILGDGTAWFDGTASGGTLVLSNATIRATSAHPDTDTATIWSDQGFDLTIRLSGSNRVESSGSHSGDHCVHALSNLAITGEGTLVAENTGESGRVIVANGSIRVDGATVTAISASNPAVWWGAGVFAISNATVTATAMKGSGIMCDGNDGRLDIADSVVTGTGGRGLNVRNGGTVAISGASVVTAVATDERRGCAIWAGTLVLGDGLEITEPAGGTLGENEWYEKCVLDPATGGRALRAVIAPPPPPPPPPSVSNVVARQRWPWNGLVDVDYEVGGNTENLMARISFSASDGRSWVATNFLAGAKPSAEPGPHRATWDTAADGVADVVAESVVATVELASRAVSLSLVHTVTLAAAPASCRAVVAYDSTEGTGLRAVVDAVDFDNAAGTARFKVLLEGEDAQIRSITLFSGTGAAFEWFDFAVPRAVGPGESVVADIRENRPYLSGSGTASDPYLIANPAQLDRVRETASDGAFYRLVKDIDFQGSCGIRITKGDGGAVLEVVDGNARFYATDADYIRGWLPIGVYSVNALSGEESNCEGSYFKGHFDGGGFLVDNLYIWADKTYGGTSIKGDQGLTVGLFGQCVSATIANVRIGGHSAIHAYTDKNLSVGAVVGGSMNKREHLFGYVKNTGDENRLRTVVTGCSSAAYIDSHGYFSSVTGGVGGCMQDCIASGCSNQGEIVVHAGLEKAMYTMVGGCFGEIYNSRCMTDADSWSDEAQQPVVMGNLSNEGAITVISDRLEGWPSNYGGGIVGYSYHVSLDGATNTADVTFAEEVETTQSRTVYLSGVAGRMEGLSSDTLQLDHLSNAGDITATVKCYAFCYVGGIAGQIPDIRSSINRCSNSGQVSATGGDWQNVGGIAGYSSGGEYVGCVNVGEVRVYGSKDDSYDYIGGIVGYMECDYDSSLSECFNMGTVSGTVVKLAGGIAGGYCDQTAVAIRGCLACGDFNVDATPGGILGKVSNDRLTAGHNAFLAGAAATAASPGGNGVWADTLAVADGAVLACEAEAADGKRLHEFLNLDDESFDWVKSTAAEGVPAGYPVPAWYDSASH